MTKSLKKGIIEKIIGFWFGKDFYMEEENKTVVSENTSSNNKKPKKRNKGLKIALITIFSIILVLGAGFAVIYATKTDYVKNKLALMTKNDTEYFKYVLDRNIEKSEDKFEEKSAEVKNKKAPESYTLKGKVNASLSAELGQMFISSSFAGIDNVGLKYEIDVENKDTVGALVTPSYNDVEIADIGGVYKKASKEIFLSIPSYKPLSIDVSGLFDSNRNADIAPELKSIVDTVDGFVGISGTKDPIVDIDGIKDGVSRFFSDLDRAKLDRLIHIVYDKVDEAELEKDEQITLNGLEKEVNVLTCNLDKKATSEVIKAYTEELKGYLPAKSGNGNNLLGYLPSSVSGIVNKIVETVETAVKDSTISMEVKFYVDDKGDILGGSVKISLSETKFKIDCLTLEDENNADRSETAVELSLNGLKLASIFKESEKKDGKSYFNTTVKPGAIVETFIKGGSTFVLTISGNRSGSIYESSDIDVNIELKKGDVKEAGIHLVNNMTAGSVTMPVDISESNTVDIFEISKTDYIDVPSIGKMLLDKIDAIKDEKFNNFVDGIIEENLGFDIATARTAIDTGLASAANGIVKDKINEMLGIYDYASTSEGPRKKDGKYVYSWDILENDNMNYEGVTFRVYDHFARPGEGDVDMEKAKADFLAQYNGQVYEDKNADAQPSGTPVIEMGDDILFDAALVMGGFVMSDYAYSDNPATIGAYEYGDGIDDMLLGMKVGDSKDLTLTLDDRFGAFAGFTGTFRITVKDIQKAGATFGPEWSERFLVGILGYESVEACETAVKDAALVKLREEMPVPSVEEIKAVLMDTVADSVAVSYDAETLETVTKYLESYFKEKGITASAGTTMEELIKHYIAKFGLTATISAKEGWTVDVSTSGGRREIDTCFEQKAADLIYSKANIIMD